MTGNWIKRYDKDGLVLSAGTVIDDPGEFRVRRRVTAWVPSRKSVAYLFRCREIWLQSSARPLDALAQVEDPTWGVRAPDAIAAPEDPRDRPVKPVPPLPPLDTRLLVTLRRSEHAPHGFTNRDLRAKLDPSASRPVDCRDPPLPPPGRHRPRLRNHERRPRTTASGVSRGAAAAA